MSEASLTAATTALETGRWDDARTGFEAILAEGESAEARFGLASAMWWLGDSSASVAQANRAYSSFRRQLHLERAVQCAVWLSITYKADFANFVAADGWLRRAVRLLEDVDPGSAGPLRGWVHVARAYRMADLTEAESLTRSAVELARAAGDADLELAAMSQLGLIHVGDGRPIEGFALIDEAMAATLGGEPSSLDTVVYACCDMLNACELANDLERATQWCRVADEFVEAYGCPFLYAECRIAYGSVLAATGHWEEAERQLVAGRRTAAVGSPSLHTRALGRLAVLLVRQGRLEEAESALASADECPGHVSESVLARAALLLARGDAAGAQRHLQQRLSDVVHHRAHLVAALDLMVDSCIGSGDVDAGAAAAHRLAGVVEPAGCERLDAVAGAAMGRAALANGDVDGAIRHLEAALDVWVRLDSPYEAARARAALGRALARTQPHEAIDPLRRALDDFVELGAAPDADRVAALLRELGVPARTGSRGAGVLTDREQQVLGLLGSGLSNPEIAARLQVSRKTAAHHVSHILTKLGLRNRAAAAAYAAVERRDRGPTGGGTT